MNASPRLRFIAVALCTVMSSGCWLCPAPEPVYGHIHEYVRNSEIALLRADLKKYPTDLEKVDDAKLTPLALAVSLGHAQAAAVLVEAHANLEARDSAGYTPLHLAAAQGSIPCLSLLIEGGAQLDAHNKRGQTALDVAIRFKHAAAADFLRSHGAHEGISP